MANRGSPLPWSTRMEIQRLRLDGETVREAAAAVGVSKTTACKYGPKPETSLVQIQHKSK